jgi:hypothetical protein
MRFNRKNQVRSISSYFLLPLIMVVLIVIAGCGAADGPGNRSIDRNSNEFLIFTNILTPGFDIGANSSSGNTGWLEDTGEGMKMSYPSGEAWGAVFIVSDSVTTPPRPSKDFSAYKTLSFEVKGEVGGESFQVGLKDKDDPDDGGEAKVTVCNLTNEWQTITIPLSRFSTADLKNLYVVMEFVFEGANAQTVFFRNVKYLSDEFEEVGTCETDQRPLADAGHDHVMVKVGGMVALDSSRSRSRDGSPLTFFWSMVSLPPGSSAQLSDPMAVRPNFMVDITGIYSVQLIVNDGVWDSEPVTATITTEQQLSGFLSCGDLASGDILESAEVDMFSFMAEIGDRVVLTLTETSDWSGQFGSNDVRAALFAPSGANMGTFDSNGQREFYLQENGAYLVRVNANNLISVGFYMLGLECP